MTLIDILQILPRTVAKKIGIENCNFLDRSELRSAIFSKKHEAFVQFDGFVKMCREWLNFSLRKITILSRGALSKVTSNVFLICGISVTMLELR
ncbi:hypothetical protein [Paraburkholderia tropica]|uniref:hypothetical protein n=1 Tax=Paraburkholderia tropica TaxID=92647 RepID=UPI0031D3FCE4